MQRASHPSYRSYEMENEYIDDWNLNPLMNAVKSIDEVKVRQLLESKADVNVQSKSKGNVFHHLVHNFYVSTDGTIQIMNLLHEAKADIEALNFGGETPLTDACAINCNETIVKHLISLKASIYTPNNSGKTPLQVLLKRKQDGHSNESLLKLMRSAQVNEALQRDIEGRLPMLTSLIIKASERQNYHDSDITSDPEKQDSPTASEMGFWSKMCAVFEM
mmetsp:Transcript_17479/g.26200  ORF Transcript_17479/g.26200 Transcript_17479/m.26200 type:complete len:219 (-) Transcript_17479:27-683(-)